MMKVLNHNRTLHFVSGGHASYSQRISPRRIGLPSSRWRYRSASSSEDVTSKSDASPEDVTIRIIESPSECLQVAKLRADAFYQVYTGMAHRVFLKCHAGNACHFACLSSH